jgi:uncharacterized protein (TIGR03546 family)
MSTVRRASVGDGPAHSRGDAALADKPYARRLACLLVGGNLLMLSLILRPLRQLAQAVLANDSPRQLAWGFVLGMWVGLLPKGNMAAAVIAMLLFGLRVNKPAGLMAAGVFTLVGFALDATAHHIGATVLLWEPLRPLHTWLYNLPGGPWLGLNNTVVVGQLTIGLYLTFPAYWLASQYAVRFQPRLYNRLKRSRAVRWLRGAELGAQWGYDS